MMKTIIKSGDMWFDEGAAIPEDVVAALTKRRLYTTYLVTNPPLVGFRGPITVCIDWRVVSYGQMPGAVDAPWYVRVKRRWRTRRSTRTVGLFPSEHEASARAYEISRETPSQ